MGWPHSQAPSESKWSALILEASSDSEQRGPELSEYPQQVKPY
jgi:hypothetical protein